MLVGDECVHHNIKMANFKEISKSTPEQTIEFFGSCLKDEPIFAMKEILVAIDRKGLSSLEALDEFGKQFAERISLKVENKDWNHWVAKLHRTKLSLEKYLMEGDE